LISFYFNSIFNSYLYFISL